jgi:hypothetical protein
LISIQLRKYQQTKRKVIILILKKRKAEICEDLKAKSLTTHESKTLTRVLHRRREQMMEEFLDEGRIGFRRSRGTTKAITALRLIREMGPQKEQPMHTCFVDLDNVDWERMLPAQNSEEDTLL